MAKQNYWFYLEPYSFIFEGETCAIIYNSLSSYIYRMKYTPKILYIIRSLRKLNNLYVVKISDKDLEDESVRDFIYNIRNSFSGDLIIKTPTSKKPVIIPPVLHLQMSLQNLEKDPELSVKQSLHEQLTELSFYITGECKLSCYFCSCYRKQFPFCHKKNTSIELKFISKTLAQASRSNISKINILGGDIFSYMQWTELLDELQNYQFKKVFYSFIDNLNYSKVENIFKQNRTELNILVNTEADLNNLPKVLYSLKNYSSQIKWVFTITDENEKLYFDNIISKFNLRQYRIVPFLHHNNISFFKNNVFINEEDILQSRVTKKDVFAHQTLNQLDYGKLIFTEDGEGYANLNNPVLGRIENDLFYLINKEFVSGKSWRNIRTNISSCKKCIYKLLCPPPSGYDYFLKGTSVCNLSPEEKGLI